MCKAWDDQEAQGKEIGAATNLLDNISRLQETNLPLLKDIFRNNTGVN